MNKTLKKWSKTTFFRFFLKNISKTLASSKISSTFAVGNQLMVSFFDSVAQLVEQLTLNQWVEGSSPSGVTIKMVKLLTMSDLTIFCFPIFYNLCGSPLSF